VKFALPRLKVAEDWRAPVHRNRAEYRWLEFAATVAPDAVPKLYGWSAAQNGFAMEYLGGPDVYLWKAALLGGAPDRGEAALVGDLLGRVHAASARPDFERDGFRNRDDFFALRIEPYLIHTAGRHPDLAPAIRRLADALYAADIALVHGDVSPKNILVRSQRPVLLDAECATVGDPAFDVAFCLNHLVLKAIHLPPSRDGLLRSIGSLWDAYRPHVGWEAPSTLDGRVAALLPALMLARIDGKSPVEYLTETGRSTTRDLARDLIATPPSTLASLVETLRSRLGD
jgi:aminoglycoside phosphotransferase (APT) family kinase protein